MLLRMVGEYEGFCICKEIQPFTTNDNSVGKLIIEEIQKLYFNKATIFEMS